MHTLVQWLLDNYLQLILIAFLLRYRQKLIFTPLAGGNGKVQMDEAAKAIILVVFVFWAVKEATRTTEHHIISDTQFFAVLSAVCVIAGIQLHYKNKNNGGNPNNTGTDH